MEKPSSSQQSSFQPSSFVDFVDDIIIDILSRLPPKDVLRCRCVCKSLKDLTSTRDFTDLHRRRIDSMFLKDADGMVLIYEGWETVQIKSRNHESHKESLRQLQFSLNGLIVAKVSGIRKIDTLIYNPIYHDDVVKISVPFRVQAYESEVYGLYFHPVHKEYCTLWRITQSFQPLKVQYRILNLESNPHWRDIMNPSTQHARIMDTHPILTEKYLYWMIGPCEVCEITTNNKNIMEYDITNENFRVIPYPFPVSANHYNYSVNMIDIDGAVSLVEVLSSKDGNKINIWTLKDDGEVLWTNSRYTVRGDAFPGYEEPDAVSIWENLFLSFVFLNYKAPKAIFFWNGELAFELNGKICAWNLKLGTCREIRWYNWYMNIFFHVTSLLSVKNWKSNMCIVEEDDKILKEKGC